MYMYGHMCIQIGFDAQAIYTYIYCLMCIHIGCYAQAILHKGYTRCWMSKNLLWKGFHVLEYVGGYVGDNQQDSSCKFNTYMAEFHWQCV